MKVCEIFASIQGESSYAGLPCVFVRLTGCNLRCAYCDTQYAYEEGLEMSVDEALEKVKNFGIKLLEITGGEPLLQQESLLLIDKLLEERFHVLIETNGSLSIKNIDRRVSIVMDIKTPKSGMFEKMDLINLKYLKHTDEVKFVISDSEDYEWAKDFIKAYNLTEKCLVLLSPAYGVINPADLAGWIVQDRLPVRLNMQLHKYIFPKTERGV
jgi:7-carboxy-7-deazaguanine synthase